MLIVFYLIVALICGFIAKTISENRGLELLA